MAFVAWLTTAYFHGVGLVSSFLTVVLAVPSGAHADVETPQPGYFRRPVMNCGMVKRKVEKGAPVEGQAHGGCRGQGLSIVRRRNP